MWCKRWERRWGKILSLIWQAEISSKWNWQSPSDPSFWSLLEIPATGARTPQRTMMVTIDGKSWQAELLKEEGGEISIAIVEPNLGFHFKFTPLAGELGAETVDPTVLQSHQRKVLAFRVSVQWASRQSLKRNELPGILSRLHIIYMQISVGEQIQSVCLLWVLRCILRALRWILYLKIKLIHSFMSFKNPLSQVTSGNIQCFSF